MRVEVKLHATLAAYLPPGARAGSAMVQLDEDATVADLIEHLAIPADFARVVLVGGHDVPNDHALRAADVVDIFPPLSGGSKARWYTLKSLGSV